LLFLDTGPKKSPGKRKKEKAYKREAESTNIVPHQNIPMLQKAL
jgi:hypothetical protein